MVGDGRGSANPPIMLHFPCASSMNTLYYGDNLKILRDYVEDESVDLIDRGYAFLQLGEACLAVGWI